MPVDEKQQTPKATLVTSSQSRSSKENFTINATTLRNDAKKAMKTHHSFIHQLWMTKQIE